MDASEGLVVVGGDSISLRIDELGDIVVSIEIVGMQDSLIKHAD